MSVKINNDTSNGSCTISAANSSGVYSLTTPTKSGTIATISDLQLIGTTPTIKTFTKNLAYQNTSSKYIILYISYDDIYSFELSADNSNWVNITTGSSDNATITVIVPPQYYYRGNFSTIYNYIEML